MSNEKMTRQDVEEILRLVQSAEHVADFRFKYGELEISVSRSNAIAPAAAPVPAIPTQSPSNTGAATAASTNASSAPVATPSAPAIDGNAVAVKAPMVGTFYCAPSPGAKPFVELGSKVQPDTVVGIIEVMKLMNSLPAGVSGSVKQILVQDSQPVGFGQALILIEPDA